MNKEQLVRERSLNLHKVIAKKLRENPKLWDIPSKNLNRWKEKMGELPPALQEWENILKTHSYEEIYKILNDNTESSSRLRSSSPFTGILTEEERNGIFTKFFNWNTKPDPEK